MTYICFSQNEEDQIKLKAKELLAQEKKQKALKLLRRKKAMEKRLGQIDANLENVQGMIDQIQVTKEQHGVVQALDKGNAALKELHRIMDPDTVQRFEKFFPGFFRHFTSNGRGK